VAVKGQEKPPEGGAPLETYTASVDDPVFRFSSHNFAVDGSPIQLQVRFPEEKTHFTAVYDDETKTIVFPKTPPVQDPQDYLIAK